MNEACKQPRPCVDVEWSWTGAERCNGAFVEREYKSNCNRIDWRIDRELSWVDTGATRCGDTNVEKEQRNDCGGTRWVTYKELVWVDTGATRCGSTSVQKQQENQCKQYRWVDDAAIVWVDTGDTRCMSGMHQKKQLNQCGVARWIDVEALVWTDTGVTRCEANRVQRQQRNQCGDLRWNTTATVCGYCADVPLPSGGYAYSKSNARRDPAATVELATATTVVGYIYPTATGNNGMTVPVTVGSGTCDSCATEQIVGYAATTCCDDLCNNQGSTLCAKCD